MRMMKRTRMNESHPHKTVICRMCVTRKSCNTSPFCEGPSSQPLRSR